MTSKKYWQLFYDKGSFKSNYEFFKNAKSFWDIEMVYESNEVFIVKTTKKENIVYTIHFDMEYNKIEEKIYYAMRRTFRLRENDLKTISREIYYEVREFKSLRDRPSLKDYYSTPYRLIEERNFDRNGRGRS